MLSSRFIAVIPFLLILSFAAMAQGQDDSPITVDTSIVRLNVGVVDGRGRPVLDLNQGNFSVFEDGIKQQINRFEPSSAPFSVVMMLDMSGSTLPFRQVMKMAAFRFVDALGPDDRVAVIEFYDKINLRNDFTTDRRTIAHSIEASNGRGKTQLFKAIEVALGRLSRESGRRKAIIVLSDGIDTAAQDTDREAMVNLTDAQIPTALTPENYSPMTRILQQCDGLGVTIYPLALPTGDPAHLPDPTPRQIAMFQAARQRMQYVADRTGGQMNAIVHLEDMGKIYAEVAANLRTLYTIEYQSSNEKRDGAWRTVKIETTNQNLISRTKAGYFAK